MPAPATPRYDRTSFKVLGSATTSDNLRDSYRQHPRLGSLQQHQRSQRRRARQVWRARRPRP